MALQRRHLSSLGGRRERSAVVLTSGLSIGLAMLLVHPPSHAQQQTTNGGIYTCVDDKGKELRADRPIAECSDREQRVLNRDGSLKRIQPATLTSDERAARDARLRREAEERAAYNDAVRRDRNLKIRFPDEAAHNRARESALESVRAAMHASRERIKDLQAERQPLLDEAEFYRGRQLPARLRQQLDANQTSQAAQRELIQTQEAELVRINGIYDVELEHLRKLWKGAPPGSISLVSAPAAEPGTR